MILVFQYESGNNRGIAEEILLKNLSEKTVMSQRKHNWILLAQGLLGWICNFRNQIPHLELSTV